MPPAASPPAGLESLQASIEGLRAVVVALAASGGSSAGGGAKSASGGDAGDRVKALHTEASLLFLDLRAANRATLESVERTREAARSARRELDEQRLLLQNVQYEKGHVRQEIRTSSEFVSEFADEDVGLCDVETFFAEMEKNETNAVHTNASLEDTASLRTLDAHALTLKRLSHELRRREALVGKRTALEAKKAALTSRVKADAAFLDGLRGELSALRTAVEPLRAKLCHGEGSNEMRAFLPGLDAPSARNALREKSLPPPTYVLFASLVAVAERIRKTSPHISVSLETGGEEDAKEDAKEDAISRAKTRDDDDDDDDDDDEARRGAKRGRKRKQISASDAVSSRTETMTNQNPEKLFAADNRDDARTTRVVRAPGAHVAHDTRVVLGLGATGAAVVFRYFPSLGVVTAEVRTSAGDQSDFAPSRVTHETRRGRPSRGQEEPGREKEKGEKGFRELLVDLFPGDDGRNAPGVLVAGSNANDANETLDDDENAKNETLAKHSKTSKILSIEWDVVGRRDRPFLWCQHLAGLDPTPLLPPLANSTNDDANDIRLSSPTETFSFENAAALERNVAAHAEQRRGTTIVAALEARVKDVVSLERAVRFLAEAADGRLGASSLVDDAASRTGGAVAVLTSFRETFGDETDVGDESDGFAWSGSVLSRRLAFTGDGKSLAERGARRFALNVEVTGFSEAKKTSSRKNAHTLRATLEVTPSFPIRPASVALAVREPRVGDGSSVAKAKDRPPPSPADADADGAFVLTSANATLGALGNDARLAEAEANLAVDADEGLGMTEKQIDGAGAALVRRVARVLRAAETYFSGDDGTRRGRERRMA